MNSIVHGILQARILGWVAFPFSRGSSQLRYLTQVSCIAGGFFTSWATREAQECWSGWPIPSPVDLPNPGIKLGSPELQVNSLPTEESGSPGHHKVKVKSLSCVWLCDPMDCNLPVFSVHGIFQARRLGCHFFFQEIIPTQGLNLGLPHCRQTLYHLSHQGSPTGRKHYTLIALQTPYWLCDLWQVI